MSKQNTIVLVWLYYSYLYSYCSWCEWAYSNMLSKFNQVRVNDTSDHYHSLYWEVLVGYSM